MTYTYGEPTQTEIDELDENLANDIRDERNEPWELYEVQSYKGDCVGDHTLQIVYCGGRAGIVLCGQGSSGHTSWTDCYSPEDALRRYLNDDMRN
jgi:hypothetical protein